MSENRAFSTVNEISDQVINDLSLNERVTMANLEDDQIAFINKLLSDYIQSKLKQLAAKQGEADPREAEAIIKEIWNRLRKTHMLRIVKK